MNSLQHFFTKTLRLRSSPSNEQEQHHHHHHHHHHHKIHDLIIDLDKEEFKSNDKITGKLILKTHETNVKDIGKICLKFYDELDIQWEEYQANTLYNTVQYKTYKKPFKINLESYLDPESAVLVNEIQNTTHASGDANAIDNEHKLYEYSYSFEFDLPCFIHSSVNMPNASYVYYIEALVQNDDLTGGEHKHSIFEHFKTAASTNHNSNKVDVCIYNEIMTPNELLLNPMLTNPQITELQTSLMHIRVTLPKKVYFSNETIPIQIDIDELAVAYNAATSTVTTTTVETTDSTKSAVQHHLKLNKIVFKLYQYCQVNSEEPEKKPKVFDYLIKHTTRKITEKTASNQLTLVENFELPDQLFSSTNREKLNHFNESSPTTQRKLSALSYKENNSGLFETISLESKTDDFSNDKYFLGIRVDYKLVIEFWKNFINQDTVAIIPVMIDPEA